MSESQETCIAGAAAWAALSFIFFAGVFLGAAFSHDFGAWPTWSVGLLGVLSSAGVLIYNLKKK